MMLRLFLFAGLLSINISAFSQILFPQPGPVYDASTIPRVDIWLPADSLSLLIDTESNELEFHASFAFTSASSSDTVENVGFGLRGNTSLVSPKKSFQVSFNTFVQGGKYQGLEKMNLNGDHNDPSVMRTYLCLQVIRHAGLPAPRCNYVELYINNNYFGLYVNVEAIDEELAEKRFGNKDGNLYKCLWPADLGFLGTDPEEYKMESGGRRVYDLKTNEDQDNYTDLAQFISIINNTAIASLPGELETVFNVNSYLKYLAAEVLTAHWDCYSFNKNNFYLYHNTATGQFEFIPYDVDNTFGIDWFSINWATRNIYSFYNSSETRPLTKRILQVPVYKNRFSFFVKQLIDSYFNTSVLFPEIDNRKAQITPFLQNDIYYPQNYGWDMNDFNLSFTQALGNHVPFGLKPFISERNSSALSQLQLVEIAPVITWINHNHPLTGQDIGVSALVEDELANPLSRLFFKKGNAALDSMLMNDDGLSFDGLPSDRFYGAIIPAMTEAGNFQFYIEARDSHGNKTRQPLTGFYSFSVSGQAIGSLVINEFMADNQNIITDPAGNSDDWIEILNISDASVSLGDMYLTDNLNNPSKWKFPDVILPAGAYYLVWADDEITQGENHASFKLSKDGEEIGLFRKVGANFELNDQIVFGQQLSDVSFGRWPNGTGVFQSMPIPTPGAANTILSTTTIATNTNFSLTFLDDEICVLTTTTEKPYLLEIFDVTGRKISDFRSENNEAVSRYPFPAKNGIYLARIRQTSTSDASFITRPFIVHN